MKRKIGMYCVFALLFLVNIHIPILDINIGMTNEAQAGWMFGDGHFIDENAQSASEPSTLLLLGVGLAGYGIYRKLKNRREDKK